MESIHHTVTVEEVIKNTATFQKNLQNIVLQRARTFQSKNDFRKKNHIAPLPVDPVVGLARISAERLVSLFVEIRERRCTSLSSQARQTLAQCGDEAVRASMEEFTRKLLRKPAEKPAEAVKPETPKRKPAARKKTVKKAGK